MITSKRAYPSKRRSCRLGRNERRGAISDKSKPFHVCFTCTGNVCRSPYAMGYLAHLANTEGWGEQLQVSSAGELELHGAPAHRLMEDRAQEQGFSLSDHQSRKVSDEVLSDVDLIVCMELEHVVVMQRAFPAHKTKVYQLARYPVTGAAEEADVPDPIGRPEEEFTAACELIEKHVARLAQDVRERCAERGR